MREYGAVKCECGACEFDHALMQWTHESEGFTRLSEPLVTTWRTVTGCSECMNRLGTSNDGRPWREPMVPRAALEWMVEQYEQRYDDEVGWRAAECGARERSAELMIEAALKAAEETADE